MRLITFEPTFSGWRGKAREAVANNWPPESVQWQESTAVQPGLDFFEEESGTRGSSSLPSVNGFRVPKRFLELATLVARHSNSEKWALLYRVLWRLSHGEPSLLENPADADAIAIMHFEKEVTKDAYRMTAFVRFREVAVDDGPWFVAWYEPEHDVIDLNANFFTGRFANMRWSILTPRRCMHWDGAELTFSEGVQRSAAPTEDEIEPLWIAYYSSIYNPARVKVRAMQAQLLKRNWKNLPEAVVIEPLIRNAPKRVGTMLASSEFSRVREADFSVPPVPPGADWAQLRDAAATCRACPLWRNASCTVFGEGPVHAKVVFVGEQPGDQEDQTGKPFIGPAGQLLNRALAAAGIDRSMTYVTNAVKHFNFEPRGKRRVHKTASAREVAACRPWLAAEIDLIKPELIVALGATATLTVFENPLKVTEHRGSTLDSTFGIKALVTVHPSSLLRLPEGIDFNTQFEMFVRDLRQVEAFLRPGHGS